MTGSIESTRYESTAADHPVREATDEDVVDIHRLTDAALLAIDHETVVAAIDRDDALVATAEGRVVGTVVLSPQERGAHVDAIAVHRRRRGQGIGRALIRNAADRHGRLTADFRPEVEPFWRSLDFSIERRDGRLWGEYRTKNTHRPNNSRADSC